MQNIEILIPLWGAANLKASPLPPASFQQAVVNRLVSWWKCSFCHMLDRLMAACSKERFVNALRCYFENLELLFGVLDNKFGHPVVHRETSRETLGVQTSTFRFFLNLGIPFGVTLE